LIWLLVDAKRLINLITLTSAVWGGGLMHYTRIGCIVKNCRIWFHLWLSLCTAIYSSTWKYKTMYCCNL